jgi:hypothetical protein
LISKRYLLSLFFGKAILPVKNLISHVGSAKPCSSWRRGSQS